MKRIARMCVLFLVANVPLRLNAQTTTETPINFAVWAGYEGNHPLKDGSPWRLETEAMIRRNNGVAIAQAYLFEGGLGHEFNRGQQVAGGYTIQYNYPYDAVSQPYKWTSQRIWEEASLRTAIGNGNKALRHRVRLEERWQARKSPPDFDDVASRKFDLRLRYKAGIELPFNSNMYSTFNDEIFFRLAPRNERWFIQNRFFAGIGFVLDKEKLNRIEVGYMLQAVRNSSETSTGWKRVNNTIRITFKSAVSLAFK
jgi:hypothetical protein